MDPIKENSHTKERVGMSDHFYAMMSRMKYIERWALMRNSYAENISEHSLEVGMLAHALAVISNKRFHNSLNAERAAILGMFHDSTEIITGDMPTPIKYYNRDIRGAFKKIEENAAYQLLDMLPEDIREEYQTIFFPNPEEIYLCKLVKAADKLSALIKCIEEEKAGNTEFISAKASTEHTLHEMCLPEVELFMEEFLPSYYKNLDELR